MRESRPGSEKGLTPRVITQGSVYQIVLEGDVVRCSVSVRPEVTPTEGAQAAREMTRYLIGHILGKPHYAGAILDVTRGPAVFGPSTRAALESLFLTAEQRMVPFVAVVSSNPIQRMQFLNLSREHAARMSHVLENGAEAHAWIHSTGLTRRSAPAASRPSSR